MKVGDVVLVRHPGVPRCAGVIVKVRGEELFYVLYRGQVRRYPARWLELI